MKPFAVELTAKQKEILDRVHLLTIATQNALDMMTFKNDFNKSEVEIDATISNCIWHIEHELANIKRINALQVNAMRREEDLTPM